MKSKSVIAFLTMSIITIFIWSNCTETDPYEFPDSKLAWMITSSSVSTNQTNNSGSTLTSNSESSISTTSSALVPDNENPIIKKVEIDGGANISSDLKVIVVILAEDNVGVTELRTSNDGGITWSEYIAYTPVLVDYELKSGNNGIRAIYVQVRDASGNESIVTLDTINYLQGVDTQDPTISYMSINNGDISTSSKDASIIITAADDVSITEMTYSTDGITYNPWIPFKQLLNVTLASGADGERKIYVKVKDGVGNVSEAVFDSIAYLSSVYVDVNKEEGNPCSIDQPCHSISEGIIAARNLKLTRINVREGTYYDSFIINSDVELSGGWNKDFTVKAPTTNITTIRTKSGPTTTISVFSVTNNAKIDGFTIYGPSDNTEDMPVMLSTVLMEQISQ